MPAMRDADEVGGGVAAMVTAVITGTGLGVSVAGGVQVIDERYRVPFERPRGPVAKDGHQNDQSRQSTQHKKR